MRGARYKRVDPTERMYGGEVYDSKREAARAMELKILEQSGAISDLQRQVPFELIPKQIGERACTYRADFVYTERGARIVEDVKGHRTEVYRLKRKLMRHIHGIEIRET